MLNNTFFILIKALGNFPVEKKNALDKFIRFYYCITKTFIYF